MNARVQSGRGLRDQFPPISSMSMELRCPRPIRGDGSRDAVCHSLPLRISRSGRCFPVRVLRFRRLIPCVPRFRGVLTKTKESGSRKAEARQAMNGGHDVSRDSRTRAVEFPTRSVFSGRNKEKNRMFFFVRRANRTCVPGRTYARTYGMRCVCACALGP